MKKKYNNIQQLIAYWQEYEETNTTDSFSDFGLWLGKESKIKPTTDSTRDSSSTHEVFEKKMLAFDSNIHHRFLNLFSRLSRLQEFYTRRLFEGLPLNNLLEFNFLFSLNKKVSYKKKEIIDFNLVEYTTGIDIIKRLIRLRLVNEFPDQLDKRSKRLKITSEGKRVLVDALIVINKMGHLFFDNWELENWEPCLHNLSELEAYHAKIFTSGNTFSGYELLQIMKESEKE